MSIAHYIEHEVLLPRARDARVLVVYDAERRYGDLCKSLANDELRVVDASESSIESRDAALSAFVATDGLIGGKVLLIYVPGPLPVTDEDYQADPFAAYGASGGVFPDGDGDEYLSLCLKYNPDHQTEIRKIFEENSNPDFAVIDNVGGGVSWPTLQHLLGAASSTEILMALLVPSEAQKSKLGKSKAWYAEAKSLFKTALGLTLKTRAKTWGPIAEELWRFVLFSEFVFDLPRDLPAALTDVPRAIPSAETLVNELCDRLRNDQRAQPIYIERADAVENEVGLAGHCAGVNDLGSRDTFPFEERTFFAQAVGELGRNDTEAVRAIIYQHSNSIWLGKGESQAQWGLLKSALDLIESCEDNERLLVEHSGSQEALIEFYLSSLREPDRLQREFEQAYGDHLEMDGDDVLAPVVEKARTCYRRLAEKIQFLFTQHLARCGWPPTQGMANADVFDQVVAPRLQESGRRVAYIMVDALRYELGLQLYQQLAEDDVVEIEAAFAQLPSITKVGMNSLLPGAGNELVLKKVDGDILPMIGDQPIKSVSQRMGVFSRLYGDRFDEMQLNKFVRSKSKIEAGIDLLVLRSVDIDSLLENNPEATLGLIHDTLKSIRVAVNKLRKEKFNDVVIVTDHGFFLNAQAEAGDVCSKPPGDWLNVHERCLLGSGSEDDHNFVIDAEKVGIRGDFPQFAGPRSMAPYSRGMLYFHGGASLQEAVVPVITISLKQKDQPAAESANVYLTYKNNVTRITTRLPVVDVLLEGDIFAASQGTDFEILLEAHNRKGDVVGEAKMGGPVNPATGTIVLKPGEQLKVTVKMQEDYEGKFKLKALDPKTNASYAELELETDYTV